MYVRNSIMQMATQLMDSEKHCLSTPCLACLFFTDRQCKCRARMFNTACCCLHRTACLEELALLSVAVWNALSRGKKEPFCIFCTAGVIMSCGSAEAANTHWQAVLMKSSFYMFLKVTGR